MNTPTRRHPSLHCIAHLPFARRVEWIRPTVGSPDLRIAAFLRLPMRRGAQWRLTGSLRSEEHTSELQSRGHLVCRLLLEKKNTPDYLHSHGDHCELRSP